MVVGNDTARDARGGPRLTLTGEGPGQARDPGMRAPRNAPHAGRRSPAAILRDCTTSVSTMKPTLDSIASAKAKLAEELRQLEQQEEALRKEQTGGAFSKVIELLGEFGPHFDAKQKAEIAALVAPKAPAVKKAAPAKTEVAPKYWLPHTGETWTGRGRPPRAFTAWEGTASHREWKAKHPDEKFPKFPG